MSGELKIWWAIVELLVTVAAASVGITMACYGELIPGACVMVINAMAITISQAVRRQGAAG